MSEHEHLGVFVEEVGRGPTPIEGVPTDISAFLGESERGPLRPELVRSHAEYSRLFGGACRDRQYLPQAVAGFFDNGGRRAWIARVAGPGAADAALVLGDFTVRAIGPGRAGNRIWACLEPGTAEGCRGDPAGFRLRVAYWDRAAADIPFDPADAADALPRPSLCENFDGLSLDPASPDHWDRRVNRASALVTLAAAPGAALPVAPAGGPLAGGADGAAPGTIDYQGDDGAAGLRRGLAALALPSCRDVALVAAPGAAPDVQRLVIAHCEAQLYRFAVLDTQPGQSDPSRLDPRAELGDTSYAAIYHPWIQVADPAGGDEVAVPPSGAVCGLYAKTDAISGVWKAPANEIVAGAVGVEHELGRSEQERLNPRGVNVVRRFPGRGIRIWGARTLSSDTLWKYVGVRRLLIFLEASVYRGTQWVVFEPNEPELWARVRQTLTLFLRGRWREGALLGAKEEEAFFVAVGRDTMTGDDILNGRLVVEIGVAPVRPAEFVIFRIFQKTAEAKA
ncbi:MAG TPA: phage tail sheath subtilisin-like domain-containing protein [Allosphingosinicella sp.]